MVKDLVVVGTGGIDIVRLIESINDDKPTYNLVGFLEKDPTKIGTDILGYPVLGGDELLLTTCSKCAVVNNVMHTPRIHEKIQNKLVSDYHIQDFPNIVSPFINLRSIDLGVGNILYTGNGLGSCIKIGNFNILYAAQIGHETTIADYNLIARAGIGSRCRIGSYNLIGNAVTLANSLRMGDDNEVGVGSVVIKNIKNNHHLMGYPAIEMDEFVKKYLLKNKKRE